ncbi:hypothetical protein ABTZ78_17295 [Streptomyces bauhiniae]|uniref:zinc finger domain-containing protein n=1 Tax=Streptomyces bauhiniae TaxID=2340725 RepID=UPI00331E0DDF
MSTNDFETDAESEHGELYDGGQITLEELSTHLSAIELRLRQLARAAETPATPIELSATIQTLRNIAGQVRTADEDVARLVAIVEGRVPMALTFPSGEGWGAAAVGTDRETHGGPAIIPTARQLLWLSDLTGYKESAATTTYPEAMAGVPRSVLLSFESKEASARREKERGLAVAVEVLKIDCERCQAAEGERCRTKTGWAAENTHATRLREAKARVDERLGYLGPNPVAVAEN